MLCCLIVWALCLSDILAITSVCALCLSGNLVITSVLPCDYECFTSEFVHQSEFSLDVSEITWPFECFLVLSKMLTLYV